MNPNPKSTLAMRPMLPEDVPLLAEIFRASIEGLAAEDYDEAQQAAWAATADDLEEFGEKLAGELTLVATHNNKTKAAEILGISSKTLQNKLKEYSNAAVTE